MVHVIEKETARPSKISAVETAEILGISERTLKHLTERGYFPSVIGDVRLYSRTDVRSFQDRIAELRKRWNPQGPTFSFIDLFAGIGGFRIALSELGGKCIFSSEWNEHSQETYRINFGGDDLYGDITKIPPCDIPDHDILAAGFPCQPFSIAGVSKRNALGQAHGFKCKTQGTLFFNIAEILQAKRPRAFLLENVKNLRSHDKGKTYEVIKSTLENDLKYFVTDRVVDAASYVPQHRERIFIVGFREQEDFQRFTFPPHPRKIQKFKSIVSKDVADKYILTDHLWTYLQNYADKHREKGNGFGFGLADMEGVTRTLSARYYKDGSEILVARGGKNPRRLTPDECARLMGFGDDFIIPVSDTQAYKQFGNAVVVPVVKAVANQILIALRR